MVGGCYTYRGLTANSVILKLSKDLKYDSISVAAQQWWSNTDGKNLAHQNYECSTQQLHESLHEAVTKFHTPAVHCTTQDASGIHIFYDPIFFPHNCCFCTADMDT